MTFTGRALAALLALLLASVGATPARSSGGSWARVACRLPPEQIQRVYDGYQPERSGDVQYVPDPPNFVGSFSSHSGPWPYLQEVPLLVHGPGHVPAAGRVDRPVTVADLAPTYADLLDFEFDAPDGSPLVEAIDPAAGPPKLILTVVWDGGGRNVLKRYPRSWPNLRRLMSQGAWYEHASVGSSPSVTPAIHASIGTGAFPRHHGIVDLRFRRNATGRPTGSQRATGLIGPSLADAFDVARGNQPVVGMVGAEGTLGMIGHGSGWEGGDADLAAAQRAGRWRLSGANDRYYDFPSYVPGLPGYRQIRPRADRQDGRVDGRWYSLPLDSPDSLTHTPAYTEYQTGVIEELIRREGFGEDDVPDLLYVNYKVIDKVGHRYSFPSRQMGAVVRAADQALGELVEILDRVVGQGQWVLGLTADHGLAPKPQTTGATIIDNVELVRDLQRTFDGAMQSPRPTQTWVNLGRLRRGGHSLQEVARYLMGYTRRENTAAPSGVRGSNERLFAAAFPSSVLQGLPCVSPGD